jgi:hypothetical protein
MTNKLYYTGSTSYCQLTDHSCKKIGVPIGSSFSLLDPYLVVYKPCKTGGRDNTSVRVYGYDLICRDEFVSER